MQVTIDLDHKAMDDITRHNLVQAYKIEKTYDDGDDILSNLEQVIKYYSTPGEYAEFIKKVK